MGVAPFMLLDSGNSLAVRMQADHSLMQYTISREAKACDCPRSISSEGTAGVYLRSQFNLFVCQEPGTAVFAVFHITHVRTGTGDVKDVPSVDILPCECKGSGNADIDVWVTHASQRPHWSWQFRAFGA
jgi:hypothetical protein